MTSTLGARAEAEADVGGALIFGAGEALAVIVPLGLPAPPAEFAPEEPSLEMAEGGCTGAPTCNPGGAPLLDPAPIPFPRAALLLLPWPLVPAELSRLMSGVPAAPAFPSGVAAKVPRRLPCGGSAGGATVG